MTDVDNEKIEENLKAKSEKEKLKLKQTFKQSGRSVFKLKNIIVQKSDTIKDDDELPR